MSHRIKGDRVMVLAGRDKGKLRSLKDVPDRRPGRSRGEHG